MNLNFTDKKIFKLVLGLGNNSLEQIENLCEIYSQAGADVFDLSPNIDSLIAARSGVKKAGLNPDNFKYCISFGVKGDTHIKKAKIIQEKCMQCIECISKCPQNAIFIEEEWPKIDKTKCIGCQKCKNSCIEFYDNEIDIEEKANEFKNEKVDMVELHISSYVESEIIKGWESILKNFPSPKIQKSICVDRSKYGDIKLISLIGKLIEINRPNKTIIQADGVAMSGSDCPESTLQAVAHAQLYQNLDAYIFLSGGTNSYTKKIAHEFNVRFDGIAIGSFARNAVNDCTKDDAIKIAKDIVNSVKL